MKKYVFMGQVLLLTFFSVWMLESAWGNEIAKRDTSFKKLSLRQCIEIAFRNHPLLKGYVFSYKSRKSRLNRVLSFYYPKVSLSTNYTHSRYKSSPLNQLQNIPNYQNTYSTALTLNQLIYDFGKTHHQVEMRRRELDASFWELVTQGENVLYSVQEAYYTLVAAKRSLSIYQKVYKQQYLHLKHAKGFHHIGRRAKIEVTKAEVDLAQAKLDLVKAENKVKQAQIDLVYAMGVSNLGKFCVDEDIPYKKLDITLEEAISFAVSHRPEVFKIDAQIASLNEQVKYYKAMYYPTITGFTSYGWQDDRFVLSNNRWSWGISLNFDLFTSGERVSQVRDASFNLKAKMEEKRRLIQQIEKEVQEAYLNLKTSQAKIELLKKSLENAKENFRLAKKRYEVGVGTNLEYADAQVALSKTENDYVNALLEYNIAYARLERSMGIFYYIALRSIQTKVGGYGTSH